MDLRDLPDQMRIPLQNHLVMTGLVGALLTIITKNGLATHDEIADAVDKQAAGAQFPEVTEALAHWASLLRDDRPLFQVIEGGLSGDPQ